MARAAAKASSAYDNSGWDMVDGLKKGNVDLDKVKTEELPAEMQKMSKEERKSYLDKMTADRDRNQKRIGELNQEREKFVAAELKKSGKAESTLDVVMTKSVREQAVKAGFHMK